MSTTALIISGEAVIYLRSLLKPLIWIGLVSLVPSILYFPVLHAVRSHRGLLTTAFAMMTQDCFFAAAMVTLTGGTQSAFTFFFSLTIIVSSVFAGQSGVFYTAGLSSIMLGAIGLYETRILKVPTFMTDVLVQSPPYPVISALAVNVVGFAAISFLSNYLVQQIRRSDIQRERYRLNLEELRQLHQSILASVASGIVTCRLDNKVLHLNRAGEAYLGISDQQARGQPLQKIFPEAADATAAGKTVFEVHRRLESGRSRSLLVTVSPLTSAKGQMVGRILAIEDISVIKQMEERLKAEERLATIGRLAAVVAHEIRNPIAAISASAQMLGLSDRLTEDEKKAVSIVVRETERLNRWVSDLLEYARPKPSEKGPVILGDLLAEVAELVGADPGAARIQITFDVEPDLVVFGDSQRLFRAFLNLARNAVEAMPNGGRLWIRAFKDASTVPGARWIEVKVSDNGPGIPRDEIDKIFDAFYTTKPGGTGLGLAVVARVVEEHGGSVEVWSSPEVGTTFTVRLPEYVGVSAGSG